MSLAAHNRVLGFGGRKGSRVGIWFPWEFSAGGAWKFWGCPVSDCARSKARSPNRSMLLSMATLIFTCPSMGVRVHGWFADDATENGGDTYETVTCLACAGVHLVNRRTGKVLGADEE